MLLLRVRSREEAGDSVCDSLFGLVTEYGPTRLYVRKTGVYVCKNAATATDRDILFSTVCFGYGRQSGGT